MTDDFDFSVCLAEDGEDHVEENVPKKSRREDRKASIKEID